MVIRRLTSFVAIPEERIMKQGELGTHMYFIMRGGCSVYMRQGEGGADSEELKVETLYEGRHFGEMGVLAAGPRRVTVIADTVRRVARIDTPLTPRQHALSQTAFVIKFPLCAFLISLT
jgi:CRP-like cAMP-binding protein